MCAEIAAVVRGSDTAAVAALSRDPATAPAGSRVDLPAGDSWWPASYGAPAAQGRQHGLRYAYFPDRHRLLVQTAARIDCFDVTGHRITGVCQQSSSSHLSFTTGEGPVPLAELRCVPLDAE